LDLALEAALAVRVLDRAGAQHLERDGTPERLLSRAEDRAHAALAQGSLDLVGPETLHLMVFYSHARAARHPRLRGRAVRAGGRPDAGARVRALARPPAHRRAA